MPQTKKSTKSSGKAASKKTSTNKKKTTAKKPAASQPSFLSQAAPYILAALAVLIAVCLIVDEGVVGKGIRGVLTGLFGGAAYAIPLFLLVRTFFWNRDREEGKNVGRGSCTAIEAILLAMLLHVLGSGQHTLDAKIHYADGQNLTGGGVIGGILGELLLMGFGKVFSVIVLFAVMILIGLYIAGITPRSVGVSIAYHLDQWKEHRQQKKAEAEEKRLNHTPTKSEIREEEYLAYLREKKMREREAKQQAAQNRTPDPSAQNKHSRANPAAKNRTADNSAQIPMDIPPENPQSPQKSGEVYHVKKRRLTELDIPVSGRVEAKEDENLIPISAGRKKKTEKTEEIERDRDTGWAADAFRDPNEQTDEVQAALSTSEVDPAAVDEKIFDEVMRRTRERVEKSRRAEEDCAKSGESDRPAAKVQTVVSGGEPIPDNHVPSKPEKPAEEDDFVPFDLDEPVKEASDAEIDIGDLSAAVTAAANAASAKQNAKSAHPAKRIDPDETDTVSLAMDSADEFDVKDIFVNPEDAELIDKLSEQYRNLDVRRETVSAPIPETQKPVKPAAPEYKFPPIDLLTEDPGGVNEDIKDELQDNAVKLVDTLKSFKVNTKIENISRGPTITRYELLPEAGTRVRSITNLVDDIALNLATTGVRIEAPIPGKSAVGIEVPNKTRSTVHLRTLIETDAFQTAKSKLTVALGEDVAGDAVYFDIAKMPHLLIAGTTGSGKSVCINTIIMSLLYKASPEDVKMILIDPKKVELNIYNGIPHLLVPVISEPKKAAGSLSWAVGEMERRYGLIEEAGKRNIAEYNKLAANDPDAEYLPSIVIVIDELADLMMTASDDVEDSICRIAQKARAAGMYLIVGTQRPSVDVITGLIKANIPSRIAFRTSNQVDSRTIIDIGSAANLIGMGDMLFNPVGALKPNRVQGAYVSEDDVMEVVSYIKNMNQYEEGYSDEIANQIEREAQKCGAGKKGAQSMGDEDEDLEDEDPMLNSAIEVAIDAGKISTSLLQRKLKLGYGRAAKIIDRMEQLGYVSPPDGPRPRDVLITRQEFMEIRMRDEA